MNNESIIIERTYHAPLSTVWEALTQKEKIKQWSFDIAEFKAEIGFEFQFMGGKDEQHQYRHLCRILEVVQHKKLAYSWRYEGYEGNSIVTFELFSEGERTRVKLTHEGLETFPANNPDLAKENFVAGWTEIIGRMLKEFVEKES